MDTAPQPVVPRGGLRGHWADIRMHAASPGPVPRGRGRLALVRYGLAQPFLGLRTIFRSNDLLGISLAPTFAVLMVAGLVGWFEGSQHGVWRGLLASLVAVAALAPVPALLFGRVFAHLAAKSRAHLGLAPQQPYLRSVVQLIGEWLAQVVLLALGVLPLTVLLRLVPLLGVVLVFCVQAAWALHWVVVEGYDNARTVPPGGNIEAIEKQARSLPGQPWFERLPRSISAPRWLVVLAGPLRMLLEVTVSLARPWRVEVDLVEDEPWVSLGFGLGAASMLAVPGLNLLFRPAVVVAGVHLRHRLLPEDSSVSPELPSASSPRSGSTQPLPTVPVA
ncbi:MAG: hypothetical protein K0V04_44270 [Deltaproteobacteria bacterium]|nr:hypothetical protein [Deltaproteobacteria bacterium]